MDRSPHELSERKAAILRDLVHLYIRTGEPVASETLVAATRLGVSSATIRNELAALEEMGYLTQPHTSAGRIPTDRGYRAFVDKLPTRSRLRDPERKAIVQFFDDALADVDEILRGTTHLLSRLTRYASLALAPTPGEAPIARTELVRIGSGVLVLVLFDSGRVEKRVLDLSEDLTDTDVESLTRTFQDLSRGRSLRAAKEAILDGASHQPTDTTRRVFGSVAEALLSIEDAGEAEHLVMGGMANIAAEQAFDRRETLRGMLEALERESDVLRLLREAAATPPVSVTIGRENPVTGMWEASMVAAPFGSAGQAVGTIGVVGPMRMDYAAAIASVRAVAERLSAAVEALGR